MVLEGLKKAVNDMNGLKQCLAEIKKKNKNPFMSDTVGCLTQTAFLIMNHIMGTGAIVLADEL